MATTGQSQTTNNIHINVVIVWLAVLTLSIEIYENSIKMSFLSKLHLFIYLFNWIGLFVFFNLWSHIEFGLPKIVRLRRGLSIVFRFVLYIRLKNTFCVFVVCFNFRKHGKLISISINSEAVIGSSKQDREYIWLAVGEQLTWLAYPLTYQPLQIHAQCIVCCWLNRFSGEELL